MSVDNGQGLEFQILEVPFPLQVPLHGLYVALLKPEKLFDICLDHFSHDVPLDVSQSIGPLELFILNLKLLELELRHAAHG